MLPISFQNEFGVGRYKIDRDGVPLNIPKREKADIDLSPDPLEIDRFPNIKGGDKLVKGLINLEKIPVESAQRSQFRFEDQISAYGYLRSAITQFQDSVRQLKFASNYSSLEAKVQHTEVASVSLTSAAKTGNYQLEVFQTAKASTVATGGFSGNQSAVAQAGDRLEIQTGGKTTQISFSSATSISGIVDQINEAKVGVTANLVFDGSKYRLIVRANDSGSASTVTIKAIKGENPNSEIERLNFDGRYRTNSLDNGDIFKAGTIFDFEVKGEVVRVALSTDTNGLELKSKLEELISQTKLKDEVVISEENGSIYFGLKSGKQEIKVSAEGSGNESSLEKFNGGNFYTVFAQDAEFNLDGLKLSSSSNNLYNNIPGMSITLTDIGKTNIKIERDSSKAVDLIQDFADSYNRMLNTFDALSVVDNPNKRKDELQDPTLSGDLTLAMIRRSLGSFLSMTVPGLKKYNSASSLGISTDPQHRGLMSVDPIKLRNIVDEDPNAILNLFSGTGVLTSHIKQPDGSKISQDALISVSSSNVKTKSGNYEVVIKEAPWAISSSNKVSKWIDNPTGSFKISINGGPETEINLQDIVDLKNVKGDNENEKLFSAASIIGSYINSKDGISKYGGVQFIYNIENQSFDILTNRQSSASKIEIKSVSEDLTKSLGFTAQRSASKVSGTINGQEALGDGLTLKGTIGSPVEGLELSVFGGSINTSVSLNFSAGLAFSWDSTLDKILDNKSGVLSSKVQSVEKQLKEAEEQTDRVTEIAKKRAEDLRKTFNALNLKLADLESQKERVIQLMRANGWLKIEKND